ncbi:MAG: DUF2971 domain-containing protein [Alphaproteobacteria bacterium]|nr:MAG: DUF2971 domain-containing protein [Alphaproteobacteria bacterium]
MTIETAKIVLERTTLRWSTPRTLNDPFDIQFDLHIDADQEVVRRMALQKIWEDYSSPNARRPRNLLGTMIQRMRMQVPNRDRAWLEESLDGVIDEGFARGLASLPQLHADTREELQDHKILCLTETPESLLMWTHYAGNHTGAVLRFRDVPGLDSPWSEAREVNYLAEMPMLADEELLSDVMSGRGSFDVASLLDRIIYTKSLPFAYEREWRISSGHGRNQRAAYEDVPFGAEELDAVILGARMSAADRAMVGRLVRDRYPHAELQQAELDNRHFRVNIGRA